MPDIIKNLNDIFTEFYSSNNENVLYSKLNTLFAKSIPDGKLYKYRSNFKHLNEELINKTIFCSSPKAFNDPFDCNIGISIFGISQEIINISLNASMPIYKDYFAVIYGEKTIRSVNSSYKELIEQMLQDEGLHNFLLEARKMKDSEIIAHFCNNLSELHTLIKPITLKLKDQGIKQDVEEIIKTYSKFFLLNYIDNGELINTDISLLGTNSTDNFLPEEEQYRAIVNELFSKDKEYYLNAFNRFTKQFKKIKKCIDDSFSIGCLCQDYRNELMWSHYANSHKGYCIEYELSNASFYNEKLLLLPVIYSENRPLVSYESYVNNDRKQLFIQMLFGLLTKSNIWGYEKEWRIIQTSQNAKSKKMPHISCIYIGTKCSKMHLNQILKIACEEKIPVKRMALDYEKYQLVTKDILIY